ncbi:MAG: hypothetical protein V1936_01280 [Patescibacteria group bacterium]
MEQGTDWRNMTRSAVGTIYDGVGKVTGKTINSIGGSLQGSAKSRAEALQQLTESASGTSYESDIFNMPILHTLSSSVLQHQAKLSGRIHDLLIAKDAKTVKQARKLIMAGIGILQMVDPTYVRPQSENLANEVQKVVSKTVNAALPKEIIKQANAGDKDAQRAVADKITQVYRLLEIARNKVHAHEIKSGTRRLLGPIFRGAAGRDHRRGLNNPITRVGGHWQFEKKRKALFNPDVPKSKEGEAEAKDYHVDRAWKPESKLGKLAYYGTVAPWLAHRTVLRPAKLILKKTVVQPAKWVYRKLIKPPYEFLLNQTIRKGLWVTAGRLTLWIGGSTLTGGLPIIPAAVETALWAANKFRKNATVRKVAHESKEVAKDVAFVGTLGIPHAAAKLAVKGGSKIRQFRKRATPSITAADDYQHRKAA